MKGVIEEFLEHIGMKKKAEYDPNAQKPWLHPAVRQTLFMMEP